jgi:hypothetical protein
MSIDEWRMANECILSIKGFKATAFGNAQSQFMEFRIFVGGRQK